MTLHNSDNSAGDGNTQLADREALLYSWSLYVAGRIGITPPTEDRAHWLRLHMSEAEQCMHADVFAQMRAEIGERL